LQSPIPINFFISAANYEILPYATLTQRRFIQGCKFGLTNLIIMKPLTYLSATSKKLASIVFFLLLFYVLPLIAKPGLLADWHILFLAGICTVLFATQPRLSITEAKEKKSSDKNTIWLIIITSCIGQVISLIDWAYFSAREIVQQPETLSGNYQDLDWGIGFNFSEVISGLFTVIGIALLIAGTLFRLYAIKVLGKYFSSTVQIKETHTIVKNGPYSLLRHPSYTGAYVAMLGSAIFLQSVTGVLIFGIGMLFVYHLRIKAEEKSLLNYFKKEYQDYCKHTYRMIPFIW
jgi:hypothetical protein